MNRRWVVTKDFITADQDLLQICVVHPPEDDKETVKNEHKRFSYKRFMTEGK
jgi:hypothetical protein